MKRPWTFAEESSRWTTPSPSPALRAPSPTCLRPGFDGQIGWERAGVRGLFAGLLADEHGEESTAQEEGLLVPWCRAVSRRQGLSPCLDREVVAIRSAIIADPGRNTVEHR